MCNDVDNPSQEDLCQLFSALAVSSSKPAILALVEPHCESYVPSSLSGGLPIILSTLYNSEFLSLNYSELLLKASECVISVTPEQADLGENLTRGQNKSRLWSRMRSSRITASQLKDACCTDPAKPTETRNCQSLNCCQYLGKWSWICCSQQVSHRYVCNTW